MKTRLLSLITREIGAIETTAADPLDARLVRDCKADSLHLVILAMAVEDEFGIELPDDDFAALGEDPTVRDVLALVERKMEVV